MASGSSDQVRSLALEKYVRPAIRAGRTHFSVAVKDLMKDLKETGFPPGNYPQVCTALRAGKFLRENGLEIEGVDGPPSGLSTTVVVRYRLSLPTKGTLPAPPQQIVPADEWAHETPGEKAFRLTSRLRGLMKEEFAAYGGGEAFLRWIRSDDGSEPPTRSSK